MKTFVFEDCVYCGDIKSLEEVVALTDDNLNSGAILSSHHEELQFNIDQFIIHTKRNLCSLEDGLVEKGIEVYACGLLSKLVSEDDSVSLPVKQIGPINEWWFSGFDGGLGLLMGIESPYSSYHLKIAHPVYGGLFGKLHSKMYITKCLIECISESPYCNFDELLLTVRERFSNFDHELFLGSIDFIIRQIRNYDNFSDIEEIRLSDTSVFKAMAKLSGASIIVNNFKIKYSDKVNKYFEKKSKFIKVDTSMSEQIFNSIYSDLVENTKNCSQLIHYEAIERNVTDATNMNIKSTMLSIGQFVRFKFNKKMHYGRIIGKDQDNFHINILCQGKGTILGETAPAQYLFVTKECISVECNSEICLIHVQMNLSSESCEHYSSNDLFECVLSFDHQSCSFESLPFDYYQRKEPICLGCVFKEKLLPKMVINGNGDHVVHYNEMIICSGDCVAFQVDLNLPLYDYFIDENDFTEKIDHRMYPERYRKSFTKDARKNRYDLSDLSQCFNIGKVNTIVHSTNGIQLTVNLFYRPQNVFQKYSDFIACDLNSLFWSDSIVTFDVKLVKHKCNVIYSSSLDCDLFQHPDLFYFSMCYDYKNADLCEPSEELKSTFSFRKDNFTLAHRHSLRVLDIFSGCGGMSFGFKDVANHICAIDSSKSATDSFRANYQSSTVMNSDANVILNLMINSNDKFIKEAFPDKHSVDIIIGGPPCQGFSEMNRFSTSEYSLFKNSMVATYLNYVEYYRPKYLLLENVRNLAFYKNSLILKIICSFLVRLGYQLRVAILQAGSYGVPQNRRRLFIIGATAGIRLPSFPNATHAFSMKHCDTSFKIDDIKYDPMKDKSVPFRMITVLDAIGDLPVLHKHNYYSCLIRNYTSNDYVCHYQRMLRTNSVCSVSEHFCKELSSLNRERIVRIPRGSGSDWRDLPNIEVKLVDGSVLRKLQYKYKDGKNGNGPGGLLRGVCSCVQDKKCLPGQNKQENTLIPWCLVHTANRHNHWSGLYGRLSWNGFFSTTVTNPDPISIQGRVLHPEQDRVLSVREFARSQGFPDNFTFSGNIEEKYRQIGNAVPPILSNAIAKQFIKVIYDL